MKKKLTVVGRGTAACLSLCDFIKFSDWDIDWVYDPDIPAVSVGEGTTLNVPNTLAGSLEWTWNDIAEIGGTPKTGIYKQNWGSLGDFTHPFPTGSTGIHFNAVEFQRKAFDTISNFDYVRTVEKKVVDPEDLDSDYVLICTGTPKNFDEFVTHKEIPVNAAYVTQCFWDAPRFTHTLTLARPYGWVFGIPLQNRCSIGYLYNREINTLEEVQEDVQEVFASFNLKPSDITNHINFRNYSRKKNYTGKIAYTGNASFFLEPLEATSLASAQKAVIIANSLWNNRCTLTEANDTFTENMDETKAMICLHYMAGSKFKTRFWENAKNQAEQYIKSFFDRKHPLADYWIDCFKCDTFQDDKASVGSWMQWSYKFNSEKLGIKEKLESMKND